MSDSIANLAIGAVIVLVPLAYLLGRRGAAPAPEKTPAPPPVRASESAKPGLYLLRCNEAATKHVFEAPLPSAPYYTVECTHAGCGRNLYPPELIERNLNELKPSPTELWIDETRKNVWVPATVETIKRLAALERR